MEIVRAQFTDSAGDFSGIQPPADAAEAGRLALASASRLSFAEPEKLARVVTETSRKLLHHAACGQMGLRTVESAGHSALGDGWPEITEHA